MTRPLVVYWNNQPTPYVVERFNAVVRNGNVDLRAWFDTEREADRSWVLDKRQWNFPATFLPRVRLSSLAFPFPDSEMQQLRPDLLVTPMDRKVGAVAALAGRAMRARVASRTLPVFETWVKRTPMTEIANHFLYRSLDGAKVSGSEATARATHYGLPVERTWVVTQSVNVDLYKQALHLDRQMVAEKKGLLGLSGPTFIYVGRLWAGKGVEYLIDAFRKLQELGIKSSLLVLGDGPDESIIRAHAAGLSEIHFAGFIQPEDVPQWYGLADALVFPTLGDPNGLVVEEAMAAGLPVISTENAGDIRSRIIEGRTGYVVPPFDSDALAHKMRVIAEDGELRRRLSSCAIQSAERYSVSKYADDFDSFVEGILSTPLRRNPSVFASQIIGRALVGLVRTVGATPSE